MKENYRPNSLTARVRRFFKDNPDEFLSYADMQAKFDCTYQQASEVVHRLSKEQSIESINFIRAKEAA